MATRSLSLSKSQSVASVCSELLDRLSFVSSMVMSIHKANEQITPLMLELERAGIVEGTPSFQQGKYLYVIGPMRNGKRRRDYIGSDNQKIAAALAKLERHQEFLKHFSTLNSLERQAEKMLYILNQLIERSKAI